MKRYAEYMARLIPVVFVVAGGQALSLFFLSYITNNYAISEINAVANIDAAFSLMLGLSTIGIGQHYSRKLLISDDFEYYLTEARSVRLLIGGSISLLGVALLLFGNVEYGTVFLSGIIACLGVEYALYAKGKPLHASFVSLFRMSGVYGLTLVIVLFFSAYPIADAFLYSFFLAMLFSSMLSIYFAKTKLAWKLAVPTKNLMLTVFSLGGAFYLYSSVKFFLIPLATYFTESVGDLYVFVKLYVLLFSVRRVYIQVFYSYLNNSGHSLKLNLIYFVGSLLFVLLSVLWDVVYGIDVFFLVLNLDVNYQFEVYMLVIALGLFSVYPSKLLIMGGDYYYKYGLYGVSFFSLLSICLLGTLGQEKLMLYVVVLMEVLIGTWAWLACKLSVDK